MPSDRRSFAWLVTALRRMLGPDALAVLDSASPVTWEIIEAAGVDAEVIAQAACQASGAPRATPEELASADPSLLDAHLARAHGVVPLFVRRGVLAVATCDPIAASMDDHIRFATRLHIEPRVATPTEVSALLDAIYSYPAAPAAAPTARAFGSATEWNDRIIEGAVTAGASDIHIEPQADGSLIVRYRVDGALYNELVVPALAAAAVVSRLKILGGLNIADRIRPQDGRSSTRRGDRTLDLRISTLPLDERGEKVVIRILGGHGGDAGLEGLGFLPAELHRLKKLLDQREGMLLVTGPTGSGKTTTLYSALGYAQTPETNVVTVEDPIEYRLAGVNQVQVNDKAGLTFATALRSLLRQDPDVILVGEIRDRETAEIAVKASMTGHLVLSTLHTNDAASAVHRLLDLGVDPVVLSASLKGVVGQRLIRKLCTHCSQPAALSDMAVEHQMILMGRKTDRLRKPVGCTRCRGTGFAGRMVVPEVLLVTPDVGRALAQDGTAEITERAKEGGMLSMWDAGLTRVMEGLTSLHELIDNIPAPMTSDADAGQGNVDALLASLLGGSFTAAPAQAASTERAIPLRSIAPVRSPMAAAGAPSVLVIDDDRDARRTLRQALEGEGFRVLEAADGEAGVQYALRLRPQVIVTELVMPKLDGYGVLQSLAGGSAPVMVYTTQTDEGMQAWAAEIGASEVIHRSADGRFLAKRISEVLTRMAVPAAPEALRVL